MRFHNQILKRGGGLSLCQTVKVQNLMYFSLDTFMLQMHSEQIAEVLRSLSAFADRVRLLIRWNPTAEAWWLHQDVLIHRRHWLALSNRVLNLVRLLGFHELDATPPPLHPWPYYDELRAAACDAARIFGPFGGSDGHCLRTAISIAN